MNVTIQDVLQYFGYAFPVGLSIWLHYVGLNYQRATSIQIARHPTRIKAIEILHQCISQSLLLLDPKIQEDQGSFFQKYQGMLVNAKFAESLVSKENIIGEAISRSTTGIVDILNNGDPVDRLRLITEEIRTWAGLFAKVIEDHEGKNI